MSFEQRLRERLHRTGTTIPLVGVDLDETMTKARRARRISLAVATGVAAIAVALAVIGSTTLLDGGRDSGVPPARDPSPRPTTSPTTEDVASAARSWLQAVERGDEDAAWELMSTKARSEVGRSRFDALMDEGLSEGFGAFADPSVEISISSLGGPRHVATMTGTIRQEGTREFRAEALPIRIENGTPLVDEVFENYEILTVSTSASVGPFPFRRGDDFVMEIAEPAGVEDVFLSIDGSSPAQRARYSPNGRAVVKLDRTLEAGRHVATIVVVDSDGTMFPEARAFEAAEP